MFLAPLCKVKMKAIIKYFAEESRQEDSVKLKHLWGLLPKIQRIYLPVRWGYMYLYTHCKHNRQTCRHTSWHYAQQLCWLWDLFFSARSLAWHSSSRLNWKNLSPPSSKHFPGHFHEKPGRKALAHLKWPRANKAEEGGGDTSVRDALTHLLCTSPVRQSALKLTCQMQDRTRCVWKEKMLHCHLSFTAMKSGLHIFKISCKTYPRKKRCSPVLLNREH